MKNAALVLLCCSTFLYACDSSKNSASDAVTDGKELKDPVVESVNSTATNANDAPSAVVSEASDVIAPDSADDVNQGESIYKSKCVACHGTGVAGAPKVGDKAVWATRRAQGDAVMVQHAIEGFKGESGYMPPKGGFMNLSDEEISITVMYMVSQSQ